MKQETKDTIRSVAQPVGYIAGAIAVIGVILAAAAGIQTVPVIAMCFGGLLAAVAAYIIYSFVDEYDSWNDGFGNEDDFL